MQDIGAGPGFSALKIAHFDDVTPMGCQDGTAEAAIALGLDRIAAVRSTIGPHARLMVDCHWRFTPEAAGRLVDALHPFGLYWLECPIAETEATIPELVGLRRRCHDAGMKLAGLEEFVGAANFEVFARKGAYDVMMPDTKYIGGPEEMMRTAEILGRYGVMLSPPQSTGPICHAASLHLCAAMPGSLLELQLDESPLFGELVKPAPPDVSGACRSYLWALAWVSRWKNLYFPVFYATEPHGVYLTALRPISVIDCRCQRCRKQSLRSSARSRA